MKQITSHGVPKHPPGKGPNGRRFCRWCHAEVPKGRSSYCNDECRKHADYNLSRGIALKRDGWACVECGCREQLETDHVIAVVDEGSSHHPNNLRTLCSTCHRKRTNAQIAARLNAERHG